MGLILIIILSLHPEISLLHYLLNILSVLSFDNLLPWSAAVFKFVSIVKSLLSFIIPPSPPSALSREVKINLH